MKHGRILQDLWMIREKNGAKLDQWTVNCRLVNERDDTDKFLFTRNCLT